MPSPLPKPLTLGPCLLTEDIKAISYREPDNYRDWCITADFSLDFAEEGVPAMVSRTHCEVHDGQELLFALLVFKRATDAENDTPWCLPSVLFGEIACTPALYEELVREIGVTRPLPQQAHLPSKYAPTPEEADDAKWAALLNDPDSRTPPGDMDLPL